MGEGPVGHMLWVASWAPADAQHHDHPREEGDHLGLWVSARHVLSRFPHFCLLYPLPAALEETCWARRGSASLVLCLPRTHMVSFSLHPPPPCPYLSLVSMATHHLACLHPSLCQGFWAQLSHPSLLRSPGSRSPVSSPWGESRGSLLFPDCHIHFPALPSRLLRGDHPPPHQPPPATAPPALPGEEPSSAPARSLGPVLCSGTLAPASLPCRGPPCQSFPFVTGLANRQGLGPEIWGGSVWGVAGKGPPCGDGSPERGWGHLKPRMKIELWILF